MKVICPVLGEHVEINETDLATTLDPQEYPRDFKLPTTDDVIGDEDTY